MKKILLLLILISAFSYTSQASHIVGGDTRFEQTGNNTFAIHMRLFRFCSGINYPTSFTVRLFDNVTDAAVTSTTMTQDSNEVLSFGDACYTPPGLCVEVYYYSGAITLANNPNGYYLTYSTGGRNGSLKNLVSGNSTWYTEIPDPAITGRNNGPKFVDYPSDGYFCVNTLKTIDFSCTDTDGDSLVYSLENPYNSPSSGGSRPISLATYNASFNVTNPLGPGSSCVIDSKTGFVTARPAQTGIYVLAVRCQEFRNGVKIGEVFRDLQYAALNCNTDKPPKLENFPTLSTFKFDEEGCFDVIATDPDTGDDFHMVINSNAFQFGATATLPPAVAPGKYSFSWIDAVTGSAKHIDSIPVVKVAYNKFEGRQSIGARFCWQLDDCEILSVDSFYVDVLAYSIGCDASNDTLKRHISIPVERATYSYLIPNVFTPNGDGENDLFLLRKDAFDKCYDALTVRVYNRWGQKVYESDDAKFSWDGNNQNGKPVSEGTYYVVLQGYYGGKEVTQNYPLTLFR